MKFPAALVSISTVLLPLVSGAPSKAYTGSGSGSTGGSGSSSCTYEQKVAAIQAEINTISSHSLSDAAKIPLTPISTRTFYITPSELGVTLPPVNVGVTADTVRDELVVLGTVLNAAVPASSVSYSPLASDGSVTVNFVQTDDLVLTQVNVREIHDFDESTCQITTITGYVDGPVLCPTTSTNAILQTICTEYAAAKVLAGVL